MSEATHHQDIDERARECAERMYGVVFAELLGLAGMGTKMRLTDYFYAVIRSTIQDSKAEERERIKKIAADMQSSEMTSHERDAIARLIFVI